MPGFGVPGIPHLTRFNPEIQVALPSSQRRRRMEQLRDTQQRPLRILRLREVREKTGLSTSTVYTLMNSGAFPRQIKLSPTSVGWIEAEIDNWSLAAVAARDAADNWQQVGDVAQRVIKSME